MSNINIYNSIAFNSSSSSLEERLNRGANGSLSLYGENSSGVKYLLKETRPGENEKLIKNELKVLRYLNRKGAVTPLLHEDWQDDSYGEPDGVCLVMINQGASLGDYCEGYFQGIVPLETFKEIIISTKKAIDSVHKCGIIHNDLHANNIVVSLVNNQWKAYVIDFGWSFAEKKGIPSWMERERVSWAEEPEDDLKRLVEDLEGRIPLGGEDPPFMEVTAILLK